MFYNWKYCSFYPNNFGASALKEHTGQTHQIELPVNSLSK